MRSEAQADKQIIWFEPDSLEARDREGLERDWRADDRDKAAGNRAMQADQRDVAAERRDDLADELFDNDHTREQLRSLYVVTRRTASADRRMAAAERQAATEDRLAAARDRRDAARDRLASAAERREASLDPLTGAHTRGAGFKELRRTVEQARRAEESFTLAFIDVDGLKAINDARGHAAGDRALKSVVQALRAHLRDNDVIIRFGGDEFLCSVPAMDETELNTRLTLVRQALAQPADPVHITIGLANLEPYESLDDLFTRADAAFYATRKRR